jgi:hypothetical protein
MYFTSQQVTMKKGENGTMSYVHPFGAACLTEKLEH